MPIGATDARAQHRVNERELPVARVYARAMLELAEARDQARDLMGELEGVVSLLDTEPDIDAFLSSPLVDLAERREVLEKMLRGRASDLLVDALQVMNAKGRMRILRAVVVTYRQELHDHLGLVDVRVTSAVPLSEELRRRLVVAAGRYTGREARLRASVDPDLIAGMVIRLEDRKIDASVTAHLRRMHDRLLDRASREIHAGGAFVEEGGTAP